MKQTTPATPLKFADSTFNPASIGSIPMVIRQDAFPNEYGEQDTLRTVSLKTCYEWFAVEYVEFCMQKHKVLRESLLWDWFMKATDTQIVDFVAEVMKLNASAWNGYRVLASSHNGGLRWQFELFAKSSTSETQVFSLDESGLFKETERETVEA